MFENVAHIANKNITNTLIKTKETIEANKLIPLKQTNKDAQTHKNN